MPPISISNGMILQLHYTYDEDGSHSIQGMNIGSFDMPIELMFNICKQIWKDCTNESEFMKNIRNINTDGYSAVTLDYFVVKNARRGGAIMCNMPDVMHGKLHKSEERVGHIIRRRIESIADKLIQHLNNDTEMLGVLGI